LSTIKKNICCPTCNKKDTWTDQNSFKPFCSERCKLIDLGEWASDTRRIPGETILPDDFDDEK